MAQKWIFILVVTLVAFAVEPLQAEEISSSSALAQTRIEIDEEAGIIRFLTDGTEKVRIDAGGLHVLESIEYGGTLSDVGHDNAIPVTGNLEGHKDGK